MESNHKFPMAMSRGKDSVSARNYDEMGTLITLGFQEVIVRDEPEAPAPKEGKKGKKE